MSKPSWKKVIDGCSPRFGIEGDPVVLKALKELVRKEPKAFHQVDDEDPFEPTVLHLAAKYGLGEVVEWLLKLPKDTMPFGASHKGGSLNCTPLHNACFSFGVKAVEVLLKHGANPLETDSDGRSAVSRVYLVGFNQKERTKVLPVIWNDIKTKHPPPNDEILKEVFEYISEGAMAAAKDSGCPKSFEEAKTYLQSSSSSSSSLKRTTTTTSSKSTSKPSSSSSNKRTSTSSLEGLRRRLSSAEKKVAAAQSKAENAERRASSAGKRAVAAETRAENAERRASSNRRRASSADKKVAAAQSKAENAERRASSAGKKVVAAQSKAENAERRASSAGKRAVAAETRAENAERRASSARRRAIALEESVRVTKLTLEEDIRSLSDRLSRLDKPKK